MVNPPADYRRKAAERLADGKSDTAKQALLFVTEDGTLSNDRVEKRAVNKMRRTIEKNRAAQQKSESDDEAKKQSKKPRARKDSASKPAPTKRGRDQASPDKPRKRAASFSGARTGNHGAKSALSAPPRAQSVPPPRRSVPGATSRRPDGPPPKSWRKTPAQVVKEAADKKRGAEEEDAACRKATTMYHAEGRTLSSKEVSDVVFQETGIRIPESTIRQKQAGEGYTARGRPSKMGPECDTQLQVAFATFIQLKQVSVEGAPDASELRKLLDEMLSTDEDPIAAAGLYDRLRAANADIFDVNRKDFREARRVMWTTWRILNTWFEAWKKFLVDRGYAKDEPEFDSNGIMISEVTITDDQLRRIFNFDETPLNTDGSQGPTGGREAHTLAGRNLPSNGIAVNKSGDSGTFVGGSTAAGEATPCHVIFSTDAENEENYKIKDSWMEGFPLVEGQFGHDTVQQFAPTFDMNPKGGMDLPRFKNYMTRTIFPLYPDMADAVGKRVCALCDGGPGRKDDEYLIELRCRGLDLFPSAPNTTEVLQTTDETYGEFTTGTRQNIETLSKERAGMGDSIGRDEWSIVVNGREAEGDLPAIQSPFANTFGRKAFLLRNWKKIGAVPLTRRCLLHKKVRHDVTEEERAAFLATIGVSEADESSDDEEGATPGTVTIVLNDVQKRILELEQENHAAVNRLIELGYPKANVFWADAPTLDTKLMMDYSIERGSDEMVKRLALAKRTHGSFFLVTRGAALNGDTAMRALEYRERLEQYEAAKKEFKNQKVLFEYQVKAQAVLALGKDDDKLTSTELDTLIKWKMQSGFSQVTSLKKPEKLSKWIDELKDKVVDVIAEPQEPQEPSVPSIEETMLHQKKQDDARKILSHVGGMTDTDMLDRLIATATERMRQLRVEQSETGGGEAMDEDGGDRGQEDAMDEDDADAMDTTD